MKKRLLAVPLALGVAGASWAGGTLHGGSEARAAYDDLLANVGEASGLALVPLSYEAGFLHSEAVTELRLGPGEDAPTLVRLRHVIEHSPVGNAGLRAARIVTTADTSGLDPEAGAALEALFGDAAPLTVDSVIGLDGGAEHAVTVAAWTSRDGDARVASEPMTWTVRQGGDGRVSGTGHWPGLTASSRNGPRVTFGASHDRFDYARTAEGLYVGEYAAELGNLGVEVPGTGIGGSLSGMSLSSSTGIVDGAYRGDAAFEIGSIESPVELDSARFGTSFDGFPAEAVAGVSRTGNALSAASFAGDGAALDGAFAAYLEALGEMLRPGLSMASFLELANAGGRAVAGYDVAWAGDGTGSGLADMETVGDAARAVRAALTLDVDADALAMTPAAMFLDPAALAPWIVQDADGLHANVVIEDLVMDVNGQPMQLDMMAGEALDMPLAELFGDAI